jgi:serine/threonine-protein kinase ULK/ATG1
MTTKLIGDNLYTLYIDKLLGSGAFSKVYLGIYTGASTSYIKTDTQVAIKVITLKNKTKKALQVIEDELYIMNIIKLEPNPHIVGCYDIIRDTNTVYIMLEYCDSKDLAAIMRKPIKESYTQYYFSQLVCGLKYLHDKNIIHRDIKPKNILLTNKRTILKVADFGFARQVKHEDMYQTMCGSPMYMSPEIVSSSTYNTQTDLWSIGMILYEMLYGVHPFSKCVDIDDLKHKMKTSDIIIPPKNIEVSPECLDLLVRLLKKDVRYRITWDKFFSHPWLNSCKVEPVTSVTPVTSVMPLTQLTPLTPLTQVIPASPSTPYHIPIATTPTAKSVLAGSPSPSTPRIFQSPAMLKRNIIMSSLKMPIGSAPSTPDATKIGSLDSNISPSSISPPSVRYIQSLDKKNTIVSKSLTDNIIIVDNYDGPEGGIFDFEMGSPKKSPTIPQRKFIPLD